MCMYCQSEIEVISESKKEKPTNLKLLMIKKYC